MKHTTATSPKPVPPRAPADLQAARREAAERYERVGALMIKEAGVQSWTFHENGLYGRAHATRMSCPKPTTRRRLYILAHECGHVALKHAGNGQRQHRKEFEAEMYAHDAMRRHGVAVPMVSTVRAKQYVARRIEMSVRRGAQRLDREAVEWTRGYHGIKTQKALAAGVFTLVNMSTPRWHAFKRGELSQ